jgi:hypothetical protein
MDRRASPGPLRNPHGIQRRPAGISSWACVRRDPKYYRWATNSDCRPSGSSVSHHRAPPAHGPPQTSSGSTPRLSGYIRAQRPREFHPRLPSSGHTEPGFGATYDGPNQVLSWREKTLQLLVRGRPVTVSSNMVKPTYILNGTDRGNNSNPPVDTTPAVAPPATPPQPTTLTTGAGRHIYFPARFEIWATISVREGWRGSIPQWSKRHQISAHNGSSNAH